MMSILACNSKTFQQPGNSQGMLSQEWVAIRTILHLPDSVMGIASITEGTQRFTMSCLLEWCESLSLW